MTTKTILTCVLSLGLLMGIGATISMPARGQAPGPEPRFETATAPPSPASIEPASASTPKPIELLKGLSQVEGLLRLGNAEAAIARARDLLDRDSDSATLRPLLAWAYLQAARYDDLAQTLADDAGLDSELRFLRAAGLWRQKHADGLTALRDLWWSEPQGIWGMAALRELATAPKAKNPYTARDASAILKIVAPIGFDTGRQKETVPRVTIEALRHAAQGSVLLSEAQYALGTSLLVDEKFSEAVAALSAALRQTKDRGFERAIRVRLGEAERRRGAYKAAERYFSKAASQGTGRFRELALSLWGQMAIEFRRYDDARRLFEAQLVDNPVADARHQALWGLGWVGFRTGDFRAARRFFMALYAEAPFGPLAPRALFWGARANEELGIKDDAARELALLERRFPNDYYAYRAQSWRGNATIAEIAYEPSTPDLRTRHLRDLVAAQMPVKALREAQSLTRELGFLSPDDLSLIERLATDAGDERLAQSAKRVRVRRFPSDDDGLAYLRAQFPEKWLVLLKEATRTQHLALDLAAGVALTESRFNPRAVSPVGAVGLMQLMPTTAFGLLREENKAAAHADIFDPVINTRLGTRYLGRLLRAFSKRPEYALAAYNAGPGAVTRWRESKGELPPDIFVEEIPYAETRDYVQRVLSGMMSYRLSHDPDLARPSPGIAQLE